MTWFKRPQSTTATADADAFQPDPYRWQREAVRTEHYLRASGLVNAAWYRSRYADVREAGIDPVRHYLFHGGSERRNPSPDFDTAAYVRQYPDAATAQPLLHFLRYRHERGLQAPRVLGMQNPYGGGPGPMPAHGAVPAPAGSVTYGFINGHAPRRSFASTSHLQPLDDDDVLRLRRALREAGFAMDPAVSLIMPGIAGADYGPDVGFSVVLRRLAL